MIRKATMMKVAAIAVVLFMRAFAKTNLCSM